MEEHRFRHRSECRNLAGSGKRVLQATRRAQNPRQGIGRLRLGVLVVEPGPKALGRWSLSRLSTTSADPGAKPLKCLFKHRSTVFPVCPYDQLAWNVPVRDIQLSLGIAGFLVWPS